MLTKIALTICHHSSRVAQAKQVCSLENMVATTDSFIFSLLHDYGNLFGIAATL